MPETSDNGTSHQNRSHWDCEAWTRQPRPRPDCAALMSGANPQRRLKSAVGSAQNARQVDGPRGVVRVRQRWRRSADARHWDAGRMDHSNQLRVTRVASADVGVSGSERTQDTVNDVAGRQHQMLGETPVVELVRTSTHALGMPDALTAMIFQMRALVPSMTLVPFQLGRADVVLDASARQIPRHAASWASAAPLTVAHALPPGTEIDLALLLVWLERTRCRDGAGNGMARCFYGQCSLLPMEAALTTQSEAK